MMEWFCLGLAVFGFVTVLLSAPWNSPRDGLWYHLSPVWSYFWVILMVAAACLLFFPSEESVVAEQAAPRHTDYLVFDFSQENEPVAHAWYLQWVIETYIGEVQDVNYDPESPSLVRFVVAHDKEPWEIKGRFAYIATEDGNGIKVIIE